jgi:hypothetical protein
MAPHHRAQPVSHESDLLEAAKVALIERGCGDPDCCPTARAQHAALEALAAAVAKIDEAHKANIAKADKIAQDALAGLP